MWPFSSSSSKPSSDTGNGDSKSSIALTEEQRMRIFGRPSPNTPSPSEPREQQADLELEAFVNSFSSPGASNSEATPAHTDKNSPARQAGSEPPRPPTYDRVLPDGSLDISPDVMYPRTMSCRQHFDQAFYCQSLGGKFNDVYRYGHIKSCSEQWGAFWFCMRTNNLPEKEREVKIQEYYKKREESRKAEFGSSEDIWEIRKVGVKKAFWKDPYEDERDVVVKE